MEEQLNISGISENLAESISENKNVKEYPLQLLSGKKVAISVSESEELNDLGLSEQHLKDISIEIARYLLVNGATMLYGGDLRIGGFTTLFAELSLQYKYLGDNQIKFINYFPFPNSKKVTVTDKANFIKQKLEAKTLNIPTHLGKIDTEKFYDPFTNVEDRYIFSECFSNMREIMAKESHARILVGGKQKNFLGYIPGIMEEAYHSIKQKKPIYLIGGFGGATKSLTKIITGSESKQLTNEFQFDSDFLNQFKTYCSGKSSIPLDYEELVKTFQQTTLEELSSSNGLSIDENEILFESVNIHEVVLLLIKGLGTINRKE